MRFLNRIFTIKQVPVVNWSSEFPLNTKPRSVTLVMLVIGLFLFGLGEAIIIGSGSGVNYAMLIKEVAQCPNILIVDECRKSGCYGEGILVNLSKNLSKNKRINLHASQDSFISLGDAATATLISKDSIIKESLEMLNEKK